MAKIKRSEFKTFLNTNTVLDPTWSLIGDGVVNANIEYNPKILEETYVSEDSPNVSVESYAPKMPVEMTALNSDAAFEYVDDLRKARSVLGDLEIEVVNVWLYETPYSGWYPAEKQTISLAIETIGGEGGSAAKMSYTINYIDDPVEGVYHPTDAAWIASPVDTELTTMVLGSGTLAPLFAADKSWLYYTTSIAAEDVTMASTLAGATIVQKVGAAVVGQGAAAALDVGANTLTIKVTVGTEEVTYTIIATRTE